MGDRGLLPYRSRPTLDPRPLAEELATPHRPGCLGMVESAL